MKKVSLCAKNFNAGGGGRERGQQGRGCDGNAKLQVLAVLFVKENLVELVQMATFVVGERAIFETVAIIKVKFEAYRDQVGFCGHRTLQERYWGEAVWVGDSC